MTTSSPSAARPTLLPAACPKRWASSWITPSWTTRPPIRAGSAGRSGWPPFLPPSPGGAASPPARPGRAVMRLSYYTDAIHAALAGHGIALGWNCLVEDLLRQGRLRRVTGVHMRTRGAYFVVVPSREASKPNADAFVEWLGSR